MSAAAAAGFLFVVLKTPAVPFGVPLGLSGLSPPSITQEHVGGIGTLAKKRTEHANGRSCVAFVVLHDVEELAARSSQVS